MADAVISVAVERAASILEEQIRYQVKLLRGVEDEVQDLSGKLGTIRNVLDDAEKRGVKEESVKQWLKKLEDTAYQMEDILDEWHYALVNHRIESQKEKVWRSFLPSPCSCLCFKKLGVRHNIGVKIEDAKAKLDEILNEKDQFKFVTSLPPSDVEPNPPRVQSTSSIDQAKVQSLDIHKNKNEIVMKLMMDDSGTKLLSIVGMGGLGKTTLAQLVYNDTQVMDCFGLRIWICVSDPFNVAKIARGIVNSVGRETIPQDTDQLELVLQKLRNSISGKKFLLVLDDVWTEKYQDWEPLKINLDHGAAGSKILVTSRNVGVAKMMGSLDHQIYYPELLSDEECWSLLRRISLPGRSDEECREFEGVGKKIAGKCKGLPLAASVLGSLLQFKDSLEAWENVFKSDIWELEKAEVDLFPHLLLSYNELSPALKRCFSYCAVYPKDSEINAERLIQEWMALGYLGSVTGKNGGVEVKGRDYFNSLAVRSLFQDIVKNTDDGSIQWCKMHDIVHDFALFLRKNDAAMTKSSCQVCSPLLVSQVHEYRSLVWDRDLPRHVCDCLASVRVLTFEWQTLSLSGLPQGMNKLIHLRSLDLSDNELSYEDLKIICRLYFLQTLLLIFCSFEKIPLEIGNLVELGHLKLIYNEKLKELPCEIGNLVELRHLKLSDNEKLKELPGEIGNLVELRHLDLSSNGELMELPESVCSLVELRIMNLRHCKNLQVLPEGIHRLRKLQRLLMEGTPASRHLPRGVGELSGLHSLGTNFYGGNGCNKLALLKKLNSLTGSLRLEIMISSSTRELKELVKDAQEADLKSKIHIHTLSFVFNMDIDVGRSSLSSSLWMDLMEALEPNQQNLNELLIAGYMGSRLPEWISSPLSSLKEIHLVYGSYETWTFPPLGRLPSLEYLRIDSMKELKCLGRELLGIDSPSPSSSSSSSSTTTAKGVVAFPKLKWLDISCCPVLSEWEDITAEEDESAAVSVMPCLEKLYIISCGSLKKLPHRFLRKASSSSLRILDIRGSSLLESQYGDKDGSEWRSISQYNPHLQLRLNAADG